MARDQGSLTNITVTVVADRLAVVQGTRLLIRGRSGAGKTTLFRVLGFLEPPTSGEVYVQVEPAGSRPERRRARVRRDTVGIVFQDFHSCRASRRGRTPDSQEHGGSADEAWIEELFDRLGITDLADQYPETLSGGEKQRVAIARTLANRPAVVLADEPTGQLDPETADRVLEFLLDLQAETGTALVVVSHDRALGERFTEMVRIDGGRLVVE